VGAEAPDPTSADQPSKADDSLHDRVARLSRQVTRCSPQRARALAEELLTTLHTHHHKTDIERRTLTLGMHTLGLLSQHRPKVKVGPLRDNRHRSPP
jgi:hypothetical protein